MTQISLLWPIRGPLTPASSSSSVGHLYTGDYKIYKLKFLDCPILKKGNSSFLVEKRRHLMALKYLIKHCVAIIVKYQLTGCHDEVDLPP